MNQQSFQMLENSVMADPRQNKCHFFMSKEILPKPKTLMYTAEIMMNICFSITQGPLNGSG